MSKDWVAWHRDHEDPSSSLARRLHVVRNELRAALTCARPAVGELRLISLCAGDGRDALPVLAEGGHDARHTVAALPSLLATTGS